MSKIKELLIQTLFPDEICDKEKIHLLCQEMSPAEIFTALVESGEMTFVMHKLDRLGINVEALIGEYIDEGEREKLIKQPRLVKIVKRWQEMDIGKLTDKFAENGIDYLLYKGLAMEKILYKKYVGRHIGDIDIFVRPSQIAKAAEAAIALGYTAHRMVIRGEDIVSEQLPTEQALIALEGSKHVMLQKNFELELHVSLDAYHIDSKTDALFEILYKNRAEVILSGRTAQTLDLCNVFIGACMHYYNHWTMEPHVKRHYCIRFGYLYEVFEATYQIEKEHLWNEVAMRVKDTSLSWRIGITLLHLYELTGWYTREGERLFVTKFAEEHKDDLISKGEFTKQWCIPLRQRLFEYDYKRDVVKTKISTVVPL